MNYCSMILGLSLLAACQGKDPTPQKSPLKPQPTQTIDNNPSGTCPATTLAIRNGGQEIDTSQSPYVQKFLPDGDPNKPCTGTYVSPNIFITAAHCASAFGKYQTPNPSAEKVGDIVPQQIFYHPNNPLVFRDLENNDVSVVILPDSTNQPFVPLLGRIPAVGEAARIVGFGAAEIEPSDDEKPVKRQGDNRVSQIATNGMVVLDASGGPLGAPGDSGGPLLIEGKLAAIDIGGQSDERYANLASEENLKFLRDVVSQTGRKICGLDNMLCSASPTITGNPNGNCTH